MAQTEQSPKHRPPSGGRKGGTTFPRIALKQALEYSDKLVSKTHTGPLPEQTILAGVFGNSGPIGKVRVSALKQFGLLEGEASAYQASPLAKSIDAAVEEQKVPLLQKAFLSSKLFKEMFTTFNGDTVNRGKIRQHALSLKVHPDSAEECVELFLGSAETARLGTRDGDSITLVKSGEAAAGSNTGEQAGGDEEVQEQEAAKATEQQGAPPKSNVEAHGESPSRAKSGLNVTLTVDSSSDPDKLQKQLELLRKFGVI